MRFKKPLKYILFGILTVFLVAFIAVGEILSFVALAGLAAIVFGLGHLVYSLIRRQDKRKAMGTLFSGILLFTFSAQYMDFEEEAPKLEVADLQSEKDAAEDSTRNKEELIALRKKQEEQERKEETEKEARKVKEIESALELAESKPTRGNYNKAFTLISSLTNEKDQFTERLETVEETVQAEEEKVTLAREAVEKAEQEETRETVDEANILVAGLIVQNQSLNNRVKSVESAITENERLAAEKAEEERIAAEKVEQERKAEEERVSIEQAAEQARIAAEKEKETEAYESVEVAGVWIAPESGRKYHYTPNCRGLNNANSVVEMSLEEAKNQGYDLCGWED